ATGTVGNVVAASNPPGGNDPDPVCTTCTTGHEVVATAITVAKTSDPAPGGEVSPGDTLTYTLTVTVANAATTEALTLVDTLGVGLTFGAVTDAGAFACAGALTCTLPAGTLPGTYALAYTATVDADATGTVGNVVVASHPSGGNDPDPVCATCATEHPVAAPVIAVIKSAEPGDGAEVRAGDTLVYTLTATVSHSATLDTLTLVDTLGAGLTFGAVTDAGAFACTGTLTCTLPAGTLPGTYTLTYTATVDAGATGVVGNAVTASGGTGDGGPPPECAVCATEHPLVEPRVTIAKHATPGDGQEVRVGDTIEYTLTVAVENSATRADVRLIDTPGHGLAVGALPAGCIGDGATVTCVLPAGAVPGAHTFVYPATVTADATGVVDNVVLGNYVGDGGGPAPECTVCQTRHEVADAALLRIVKTVGARTATVGDLVRYTLTVENVGAVNVVDGIVVDTPPAGFSYVEGSMAVADRDGAFTLDGLHPLRIGGLDIAAGEQATIVYLLRVGAGVRAGVHVNEAVAVNAAGERVSNVATAQVALDADPLLDDSLVFGTVFDDRDGDGWQDRADLSGVRVQGGFAPGAYVAGSTTIDRGDGPQPLADASAPLLHGIEVGAIPARQSVADPIDAHRVTIRQRLHTLDFTGDFVLASAQGVTVRMTPDGSTRVERDGEAAKGLNAAEPVVTRSVAAVEGGYEVAYAIANHGIDERGIPGVRIASVEGLLIETDQYGRYHLADVHGGERHHGRNFILKVDPATLPPGAELTTANPLVRRITPGLPVRFDFGVRLPVEAIPGGEQRIELELGEVLFAPDSAEVREAWLPAIERMAEQVARHDGGEVAIAADGGSEALAFARAAAVRDALQARLGPEAQAGLRVGLRTRVEDPHALVAGVDAGGALLGTVLFDTDRAEIRPEFAGLLDAVAQRLEGLGGGVVAVVGHTDARGSHAYNAALGLRRATAVQQALAARLSAETRGRVRVESSGDPTVAVGTERE
ncbi:OmpA family protein, partial [Luteimonas abyssi]|uniref:OmpA family protein n=1 Tax=Luteimonas abyssi TaxID=1247514 RepID=UPI00192E5B19